MRLKPSCPFCRKPSPRTAEALDKLRMKRVEANDPMALFQEGGKQHSEENHIGALHYYTKAAELGVAGAYYRLGLMHLFAEGVEKDEEKGKYLLEEAAIGGHPKARFELGLLEIKKKYVKNVERAIKHWLISAAQGEANSIKPLMEAFKQGFLRKDDLASALRANQAAVDATKSAQRKAAEESGAFD